MEALIRRIVVWSVMAVVAVMVEPSYCEIDKASPKLAQALVYGSPDGTGDSGGYVIYYDASDSNEFYYTSGYSTPNTVSTMHCAVTGLLNQYVVESIEGTEIATGNRVHGPLAQYNENGRILQIEQPNKDPCEPNDVFTFTYDANGRVKALTRAVPADGPKYASKETLDYYCDNCPMILKKAMKKVSYINLNDPNDSLDVWASHDTDGRLASITYKKKKKNKQCYAGQLVFAYDPNGRIISFIDNNDDDCDGLYERQVVSTLLLYDPNGRLVQINDSVSDSNILEWTRTAVSGTSVEETIRIKSVFGDPNVDTLVTTIEDTADSNTYTGSAVVSVPDSGGAVSIRNWNWWGEPAPPSTVSADVNWANPEDGNVADANISNRVILPILALDGRLAATLDSQEISICTYTRDSRKEGHSYSYNGTTRNELHFYDMAPDGNMAAMLTMDEYGSAIVGVAGDGGELMRFNFFEAWPSVLLPFFDVFPTLGGGGGVRDAWGRTNIAARFNFFEAWPSSWGPQPYVPVYSETGDGTKYVAGAVTPGGAYVYYQYGSSGQIEAIVRMNSVDIITCTDEIAGDANGDCKIDFGDFAVMANNWLVCNLEYPPACW